MNVHNFKLNSVFIRNAKKYQTRPVMAAKYSPDMENGFIVFFSFKCDEGAKFFPTEKEAWDYINANNKQYVRENGKLREVTVECASPLPVLYRKDNAALNKDGIHFCAGEHAIISDESCNYEFLILENDS